MTSPKEDPPVPAPSLTSLPTELLFKILDYETVPLELLYFLRFLCKSVRPVAAESLFGRVNRALEQEKDVTKFGSLIDGVKNKGETYLESAIETAGLLAPYSLGCLLRRAGISASSSVALLLAQLPPFGPTASPRHVGLFCKGLGATANELRPLLRALSYGSAWNGNDRRLREFLQIFDFTNGKETIDVELYMTLSSESIQNRFVMLTDALGYRKLKLREFRVKYWRRIVQITRLEDKRHEQMITDLAWCVNRLRDVTGAFLLELGLLLAPGNGMSTTEAGTICARLKWDWFELFWSYLKPGPRYFLSGATDEERATFEQDFALNGRVATPAESKDFFTTVSDTFWFAKLVGQFLIYDIWPTHIDPDFPNLGLPNINDSGIIFRIVYNIAFWDDEAKDVGFELNRFRKFIEANALDRDKWIRCTWEQMCDGYHSDTQATVQPASRVHVHSKVNKKKHTNQVTVANDPYLPKKDKTINPASPR